MHAVGQQPTVETLFITVATHATMERTVVFYGVWSGTKMWKCFLCGLFTGYIAGQLRGQ
jgi:hypothetical protein